MKLFILGLRRSGTTIFWKSFRKDSRLLCYDEPFNPTLIDIGAPDTKKTLAEFRRVYEKDPRRWCDSFAPIEYAEQLQESLGERQQSWLRYLIGDADHFAIDLTRCHFKLAALSEVVPDAIVVHLYRPASAFATSHLAPRAGGWRAIKNPLLRASFFRRHGHYHNWGMERMIGNSPQSLFGQRLRDTGIDPEPIYRLPAAGRLLALWRLFYERIETDGKRIFGDRFLSVPFVEFCDDPSRSVGRIYERGGLAPPGVEYGDVHAARGAFKPDDRRWLALGAEVGLPVESGLLL